MLEGSELILLHLDLHFINFYTWGTLFSHDFWHMSLLFYASEAQHGFPPL